MSKHKMNSKFQEIAKQIGDAVVDFTTLEVTTLTGDVTHLIKSNPNKKSVIDVSDIMGKLKGNAKGKIHLVAHTQINFDHDTINFIRSESDGEENKRLFELHQAAVASANAGRNGFLSFLQKALV